MFLSSPEFIARKYKAAGNYRRPVSPRLAPWETVATFMSVSERLTYGTKSVRFSVSLGETDLR